VKKLTVAEIQYALRYSDEDLEEAILLGLPVSNGKGDIADCIEWHIDSLNVSQRMKDTNLALGTLRGVAAGSESAIAQVNAAKVLLDMSKKDKTTEIKDIELIAFIDIRNADGVIEATELIAECPQCGQRITKVRA